MDVIVLSCHNCVVVVVAKSLGIYHRFSPFMSLVSKFGMLVTVRALAEYPPGT